MSRMGACNCVADMLSIPSSYWKAGLSCRLKVGMNGSAVTTKLEGASSGIGASIRAWRGYSSREATG